MDFFKEIKGLKYYLAYAVLMLSLFAYSGLTGWRWFHSTKTENTKGTRYIRGTGHYLRYHK
jgi:hypothetical protein